MDSKKPPGAEFKRRRIAKEAESVRNTPTLESYFTPKQGLYFSEQAPKKKLKIEIASLYSFCFKDGITTSAEIPPTTDSNLSIANDLPEEMENNLSIENEAPEEMKTDESLRSLGASALNPGHYLYF